MPRQKLTRRTVVAGVFALAAVGSVRAATADDAAAFRDLATATDFRLRVAAALALGKSTSPGARPALEKALSDPHPAVRAAAAAALGSLGNAAALPALNAALGRESDADVKAALQRTIGRLSAAPAAAAPATKARFLVAMGKLENRSAVPGADLLDALKAGTRTRMAQVPGVEVLADGADPGAAGKTRNLPAFALDGSITKMDKKQGPKDVGYAARVEYILRKMPDQVLKGTLAGAAQAVADLVQVRGQSELSQLQLDALAGAVDSALKGASPTLEAAAK